jgi:hypothetical protein
MKTCPHRITVRCADVADQAVEHDLRRRSSLITRILVCFVVEASSSKDMLVLTSTQVFGRASLGRLPS